jgi:transcriptional pleiotropic regulator of transition state genes
MKSTGIVRKLDNLGRIVIPKELRDTLGIEIRDSLEIFTEGENIIVRKYAPGCVICGEAKDTMPFKGKLICTSCIREVQRQSAPLTNELEGGE